MKKTDKNAIIWILLILIIVLEAGFLTYTFAVEKKDLHFDEVLSYGFANSPDMPYLENTDGKSYFGRWISTDVFGNYLTANRGERFAYASVYSNVKQDYNPPLYSMLLHTVSSLFSEYFSVWYGFAINIFLFIGIQILIFLLVKGISGKNFPALFTCAFYGLTTAALGTVVYLRMFALLTCLALFYLVLLRKIYQKQFQKIAKESIALIFCMALGGFTHYFFYVFAFFMTAFLCLYLLLKKNWKSLAAFAGMSALGAGVGILLYPSCIGFLEDIRNISNHNVNLPFWNDLEYCLDIFSGNTLGMRWYIDRFLIAEWLMYLAVLFVFAALVFALLRKEKWFSKIKEKTLHVIEYLRQNTKQIIITRLKATNWFFVSMILSVFATLTVISRIVDVWGMASFCDRYLFFLMPMWVIAVIYGMYLFLHRFLPAKISDGLLIIMAVLVLAVPKQIGNSPYLFQESGADKLTELTEGADCIVVTDSAWSLEWYCAKLYRASDVYMIQAKDLEEMMQNINEKPLGDRDAYLILAQNAFPKTDEEEKRDTGVYQWMRTSGTDKLMDDYLKEFLNICDSADKIKFLYEQPSVIGKLRVYKLILSDASFGQASEQ